MENINYRKPPILVPPLRTCQQNTALSKFLVFRPIITVKLNCNCVLESGRPKKISTLRNSRKSPVTKLTKCILLITADS
ncbi:hypothetical protein Zmor_000191 [Zophobas morio]|uniref:Uncharacterized protein n=1 Tax=Zophobas morio TaxID=2755281 RepID=A0AA38IZJ2_9CUCU|nr:hypothetical protein Zmor_000191 [Zophobas morio]